jgi:YfiR/HmsC-like
MNAAGFALRLPRRIALASLLVGALGLVLGTGAAQAQQRASEASVKAAYLYKFLGYVDWPPAAFASAQSPVVIGVLGAEAIAEELKSLVAGKHVNERPVTVRKLEAEDPLDGLHVLFVARPADLPRQLERTRGAPILTVTDGPRSLESGSMLNLIPVDGRIRFEAAPAAAEHAGLKLGARLLSVAERVLAP